ncbi:MAG: hypothetical protein KF878_32460 [Planctomycetes bacterium]|nr:hypothetical protein [Planctomycetota bacterium]
MTSSRWTLAALAAVLAATGCGGGGGKTSTRRQASTAPATSGTPTTPPPTTPTPGAPADLAAGPANPGPGQVAANTAIVALQARVTAHGGPLALDAVTVGLVGTGAAADVALVRVVRDVDSDGRFDAARDQDLGQVAAAPWRVTFAPQSLPAGGAADLLVLVTFRAGAPAGRAVTATIAGADVSAGGVAVTGTATGAPVSVAAAPARQAWRTLAAIPTPRADAAAVGLATTGLVHVVGGQQAGAPTASHEAYDPATDRWRGRAPLLVPRRGHAVAALGGRLYVVGGRTAAGSALDSVEEYDPATDTWRLLPALPLALFDCGAVALGGELWVVAGTEGVTPHRGTFIWSPAAGTWRQGPYVGVTGRAITADSTYVVGFETPSQVFWGPGGPGSTIPVPGGFAQAATVLWDFPAEGLAVHVGQRAYHVGGRRAGALVGELRSIEVATISAGGYPETHAAFTQARERPAVAAHGGTIYVFGGDGAGGAPVAATEAFTP